MVQVKLQEQPEYEFVHKATVRPKDINYRGHLGNDAVVALLSEGGLHMLYSLGFKDGLLGDNKTGVAMVSLSVNYKAQAFMFDELEIETHVREPEEKGFTVFHRIKRGNDIIALGEVYLVTFDYINKKTAPVPEAFIKALNEYKQKKV